MPINAPCQSPIAASAPEWGEEDESGVFRAADDSSFASIYRNYYSPIRYQLRRLGVRESEVDDLTQEVFLIYLRRRLDLETPEAPLAWLKGVARGVIRNYRRAARRRVARLGPDVPDPEQQIEQAPSPDNPERRISARRALHRTLSQLSRLTPDMRESFLRVAVEGYSALEVATELEVSTNAVQHRVYQARRKLRAVAL